VKNKEGGEDDSLTSEGKNSSTILTNEGQETKRSSRGRTNDKRAEMKRNATEPRRKDSSRPEASDEMNIKI
jgi:hypothetical protein